MSDFVTILMLDAVAVTGDTEGAVIDTSVFPSIDKNLRPSLGKSAIKSGGALFSMSCTGTFTGTDMAADVVAEIDGVDHVLGSFTDITGNSVETIVVAFCPDNVKIVLTENSITVMTAKFHVVRF